MPGFRKSIIATVLLTLGLPLPLSHAEDIDIYASPLNNADNPNVLIVIDNSANWASAAQHWPGGIKQGQSELNAVRTVLSELGANINVGLMMFTEGSGSNQNGGYVRFHIRPMNATNKTAFTQMIGLPSGCTDGSNSLNSTPNCIYKNFNEPTEKVGTAKTDYSATMFEAFKYFGGYSSPALANANQAGSPVDASHFGALRYAGNPDSKVDTAAYSSDAARISYNPPITGSVSCAKNYIIFIGNGFPTQDSPASLLSGVGGNTNQLDLPNFTIGTTTGTDLLATTSCGTYSDTNSCATAAASTYGTAYPSYSCSVASTCSSGGSSSVTSTVTTTACAAYASQAACNTAAASGAFGSAANTTYACSTGSACSEVANTSNPVVADTGCIAKTTIKQGSAIDPTKCSSYASSLNPIGGTTYSGFTCTELANSCGGSNSKFAISATTKIPAGQVFTVTGTTTTTTTTTSDSHNIFGNKSVIAVTPTGTSSAPASSKIRYTDEWARFLYTTDVSAATGKQNVKTFTIDVFKDLQDADQTGLLMSMAQAGGGKYFSATDENAIKEALRKIFAEIQSVSSVFASSSLPVSVNTQGTYLNQVFIGMFRPDGEARPRWAGNLKQYQLKLFGSALNLADKNGNQAISSTTGFLAPCAHSLWSGDTGTYWNYPNTLALGSCTAVSSNFPSAGSASTYSDAPDGDMVEKGGIAQKLRGTGVVSGSLVSSTTRYALCGTGESPQTHNCRNVKTCSASTCTSLIDFTAANSGLASDLVDWVRGKDVDNENGNVNTSTDPDTPITAEVRPSVHGGVVHSQPAVIDYGGSTGVIAFYGSDDGMLHSVDGGKTDAEGQELWSFVAPETYSKLSRLRDNGNTTALINFPNVSGSTAPKDYFFDGSIGVHQKDSTVWIFATMRRGGRAIYAFDVSTPTAPTLKWRKGCFTSSTSDNSNCSAGWSSIGQTWSKPQIGYLQGYTSSGVAKPVLVFGGGYDTCEDTDSQSRCSSTPRKGANIWFVDANDGTVLRTYPTLYSVPGEISLVKDTAGFIQYAYAGDTGGNLYRINVGTVTVAADLSTTFTGWTSNAAAADTQIAALSASGQQRKFIFGPDVTEFLGRYYVAIGSGDREHPLIDDYACHDSSQVTNQFYIVKDNPGAAQSGADIVPSDLTDITSGTTSVLDDPLITGWRFNFNACEQTVNKALTIGGKVFFGTNQPTATTSACTNNLGVARGYSVDFGTGQITSAVYESGGLPPSAVAGVVQLDDGTKHPFCIGCGPGSSPLESSKIAVTPPPTRSRIYWYLQNE